MWGCPARYVGAIAERTSGFCVYASFETVCLCRERAFCYYYCRFFWRAATVLGVAGTDLASTVVALWLILEGVLARLSMSPETIRRKLDATPRCASNDIRAACQGKMNQGLNMVVLFNFSK